MTIKPLNVDFRCRDNGGIKRCYSINFQQLNRLLGISLVSLTGVNSLKKFKKGDLTRVLVFGRRTWCNRGTGISTKLNYNGVISLKKDRSPVATRIYGSLFLEARPEGYVRLAALSKNII